MGNFVSNAQSPGRARFFTGEEELKSPIADDGKRTIGGAIKVDPLFIKADGLARACLCAHPASYA